MRDLLGFLAYLVVPLVGFWVFRLRGTRSLSIDGRLSIAAAAGALTVTGIMTLFSLAGMEWSRTRLLLALLPFIVVGLMTLRDRKQNAAQVFSLRTVTGMGILLLLGITVYGLLTARETCGDLLFFWGPKAVHFAQSGKIDVDYLANPDTFLAHADYPPLLPLLFSWSHVVSRQFSWWAALLLSGLCLAGIVALVRSGTRDNRAALLAASILAYAFAAGQIAGAADPVLLFFEAIAVTALLFIDDPRTQAIVASIGVAGAVMTKVEGASFGIAILLAMILDRRSARRSLAIVFPASLLLGCWVWFITRYGLLDTYHGKGSLTFRYFGNVIKATFESGRYDAFWIPWIAPLVIVLLGDWRRARLPLSIAVLTLGATVFFYLHGQEDPSLFWIPWSASRVLLTPLLMLVIAAAVAHTPVPQSQGRL